MERAYDKQGPLKHWINESRYESQLLATSKHLLYLDYKQTQM